MAGPLHERAFAAIRRLAQEQAGIALPAHKRMLVAGRLGRRLRALRLERWDDYVERLTDGRHPEELAAAVDLLTTNETHFFREPAHFEVLADYLASRPARHQAPPRVWSAAGSTGAEGYSIAMVLAEQRGFRPWEVLVSDVSHPVLEVARAAVYPLAEAAHIPPPLLHRYCLRGTGDFEGRFRIDDRLRARVRLAYVNLVRPLPPDLPRFDLVFLRNVLIYFDRETKRAVVRRVLDRLLPGGLLLVGHAEGLHGLGLPVRQLRPAVYRRDGSADEPAD